MTRAHGVLALLLAAALAWAYALTRVDWWPAKGTNQPVAMLALEPRDVLRVEYAEGGSQVSLKSASAVSLPGGTPSVWIEAQGPAAAPEGPRTQPPGSSPSAPSNAPDRAAFRGGPVAAAVLRELARLTGTRDLGRMNAQQLETFGLVKSSATLRIERRGGEPLQVNLGHATLGGVTRYAQLQPDGHVFLVPQSAIRSLEHPRRLMDREWLPFNLMDARLIEAKLGARTLTVWRIANAPHTEPQRWSRKRDAPRGEPAALAWMQALAGVKVLDYLDAAAVPAGSETVLEVTVHTLEPASSAGTPVPNALGAPPATAPVVLRVFKADRKADPGRLRAVSGYTVSPIALSAPAVQAVLDLARPLLDSH